MDNGPSVEKDTDLPDSLSYCVDCGTVMVYDMRRDCPGCHLNERLDEIEERIEKLELPPHLREDDDGE